MTLSINNSNSTLPFNTSNSNQNEDLLKPNKVSHLNREIKDVKKEKDTDKSKFNLWLIVGAAALGTLAILAATILSGGTAPTLIVVTLGLFQTILSIGLLTQKIALKSMDLNKA